MFAYSQEQEICYPFNAFKYTLVGMNGWSFLFHRISVESKHSMNDRRKKKEEWEKTYVETKWPSIYINGHVFSTHNDDTITTKKDNQPTWQFMLVYVHRAFNPLENGPRNKDKKKSTIRMFVCIVWRMLYWWVPHLDQPFAHFQRPFIRNPFHLYYIHLDGCVCIMSF